MKLMVDILVDVSHTMSETLEVAAQDGNSMPSKLDMAINAISTQILAEQLRSKTSEFCLQTYGASTTCNYLHNSQGGYDNVNEIFPMGATDASTLQKLHSLKASDRSVGDGDIIDGLAVGLDVFLRINSKLKRNRILILITDGESKVEVDDLGDLGKISSEFDIAITSACPALNNFVVEVYVFI
jgi:hypothetical protein